METQAPTVYASPYEMNKIAYKWIALSNTTLGVVLAAITGNIVLISLPAIFNGMHLNPLSPSGANYMMWMLMGYNLVTATFIVSFGRVSDRFGRVKLYNLGFLVFTIASVLLSIVPAIGSVGVVILIALRLMQGVGAGFLFSNSTAIITDAFPKNERGTAMGINQIFSVGGSILGIMVGGILSVIHWRWVFLVSVPVGIAGTLWAYFRLKELATPDRRQTTDWLGNITFAAGLTLLLAAVTVGIMPYGADLMGWRNPLVIGGMAIGIALLITFILVEMHVKSPMFDLRLFHIREFAAGNVSLFLSTLARGGLQFILIIWLQGIWLPLHGFNFEDTPLWAGIYMMPMTAGFFVAGPLCGKLSDRWGARWFATGGMLINVVCFLLLNLLPANFGFAPFCAIITIMGIGNGMFAAPNTASIMNVLPADKRGVGSGMRASFMNTGMTLSMALYFAILLYGMAQHLPATLQSGLAAAGVPAALAAKIAALPPTGALFAAFLGYNPMGSLLDGATMAALPEATRQALLGTTFFPQAIAPAVMDSLHICFYMSAVLALVSAAASWLRGPDGANASQR
jgi:MFS family permease